MSDPMRVLYYNWVDYLDDELRGGGVTVYQRNLMAALVDQAETAPSFLSSGISYDVRRSQVRWEQTRHGPDQDRARRYEIINSGVLSPAHHSFGNPTQLSHEETTQVFFDFVEKTGPYDVIHFNNLEGVPADVLKIKERYPQTKVILSLHNYYPICPQVNLWHQERIACSDFENGVKCETCLMHKPDERLVRLANAMAYHLKCRGLRPGTRSFDLLFHQAMRIGSRSARAISWVKRRVRKAPPRLPQGSVSGSPGQGFGARRTGMIARINQHCDLVLCVSDRVCEIAERYGISREILRTSYIGVRDAVKYAETQPKPSVLREDRTLTLAFLGYMRRDKGFFFLLSALEALPDELAKRLRFLVAARPGPPEVMDRLASLRLHLAELRHVDGYTHDGMDDLLQDVDVGVVPVLWEDNLPQVAIEMHARHLPLLTADMGGAQELSRCSDMIFKAGDITSFEDRIRALLEGEVDMDRYWAGAIAPKRMDQHLEELNRHYSEKNAAAQLRLAAS